LLGITEAKLFFLKVLQVAEADEAGLKAVARDTAKAQKAGKLDLEGFERVKLAVTLRRSALSPKAAEVPAPPPSSETATVWDSEGVARNTAEMVRADEEETS
jgi:hypothetical protein